MITGTLSVSVGAVTGPPPDSDLIYVEWWAIPRTGSPFVMVDIDDFDISGIAGSRGAISVDVPAHTPLCDQLLALTSAIDSDLEVEIRLFGGHARSLRGFLQASDGDEVAETGQRRFSGTLVAQRMYEAVLYPNAADEKGETKFAAANAGQIVHALMSTAKARGALADVTTATFNTAFDSRGVAWNRNTTVTLSPGSPYGEILEELQEQGLCEWEVTGARELRLYVPGSRGLDRTTGTPGTGLVVLHRGRDLVDAGRTHNVREAITALLVAGKDGLYDAKTNPAAETKRGRRIEGYTSNGQIAELPALEGYSTLKLASLSVGQVEISHGLVVNGPGPQPFLDFDLGDWVWSDTGRSTGPEKLRVQQISLTRQSKELTATAVVGTLSMSANVSLTRRLNRLERGASVVGTSVDPVLATGEDTVPPAAPIGLVAGSQAFTDPSGFTTALVTVGWEAVTMDARHIVGDPAKAADIIASRIASGQPVLADWTWVTCPQVVLDQNDFLLAAYAPGDPTNRDNSYAWLRDYATDRTVDGAATDDVAGYHVQYAYANISQVSSGPQVVNDLAWIGGTPGGTPGTQFTFPAEAGVDIAIRVNAYDRSGNEGVFSEPILHTTEIDDTPPARPSTPLLSTYLRTLDIYWDGLDLVGAAMPVDFERAALIVSQEASPTVPAELIKPADFDPTNTTGQFVANLYAGGTYNVANLPVDVGYYAVLVAIDRTGNRSVASAAGGPAVAQRLVQIEVGPNAIGRQQIIDAEIVRAKIADLAVNTAKCEELSVGLLTAGTMTATVTNSGLIRTATSGNRLEFDAAGIRLFQGNTIVGRWQTTDASMLMTGTFRTGLTGERIYIDPDGSMKIYGAAGIDYASIENVEGVVRMRSRPDAVGRRSTIYFDPNMFKVHYGTDAEVRTAIETGVTYGGVQAACVGSRVDLRFPPTDGTKFRAFWTHSTNGGPSGDYANSVLHYYYVNSRPVLVGPAIDIGLRWEYGGSGGTGRMMVTGALGLSSQADARDISCRALQQVSMRAGKRDIELARHTLGVERMRSIVQAVRAKSWKHCSYDVAEQTVRLHDKLTVTIPKTPEHRVPTHFGFIAEELLEVAPQLVHGRDEDAPDGLRLAPMEMAAVAWDAAGEAHDRLDELERQLEKLTRLFPDHEVD